ncbi:hypothetical protein F5B19DRAFT_249319 [Rostrohypoxylon terebratum]|nr:hypothetical protein F5B19DRAFT_249319 [Rostrohypoxylon terebratum]
MASGDNQPPEGLHGSSADHQAESGTSRRRRRTERSRMPEDERRARQERRQRRRELRERKPERTEATSTDPLAAVEEKATNPNEDDPEATGANETHEQKPWETLVIGYGIGENLSHIQRKDREIEQHRFIVRYHQEHSPHEVAHNQKVLDTLIKERSEMEDNEENNMPENQREEKNRVGERLHELNWALDTCQCEAEEINIRAAIEGYQSGEIPYSDKFTLIYAGHIADVCPTYRSFCIDRKERLDRYYERFGPGWLWQEPPLSDGTDNVFAKKGLRLSRRLHSASGIRGPYFVYERFSLDRMMVSREDETTYDYLPQDARPPENPNSTTHLITIMDSGATYPLLPLADFKHLSVDLRWLAAQGVASLTTASGSIVRRFYELHVTVCTKKGESLVGSGDDAVYPNEERTLGGLYPVTIDHEKPHKSDKTDRLSGLVPFDYCYLSSTPGTMNIWLGEDRRDVLGAGRMPALARYDAEMDIGVDVPPQFTKLRKRAKTPDEVLFKHYFEDGEPRLFVDRDWPAVRGRNELSATYRRPNDDGSLGPTHLEKCILEPRVGTVWASPSNPPWRKSFLSREEFEDPEYKSISQTPPSNF